MNEYGVRYTTAGRSGRLSTREKFFGSEEARERFIERLEQSGDLVEIVAWVDPN